MRVKYTPPAGGGSVPAFAQAMASFGASGTAAGALVAASATTPTLTLLATVH